MQGLKIRQTVASHYACSVLNFPHSISHPSPDKTLSLLNVLNRLGDMFNDTKPLGAKVSKRVTSI
jgi:hypothetical protein